MRPITQEELESAARALVTARKTNLGVEVTMPVIYPNGQAVTVVVNVDGGDYIVHDAGFGAMYLTSAGIRLSKQLARRLVALATHYGCDFIENRMTRRCSVDHLAVAIAMVANASRTVGDQALEVRRRDERDFRKAVSEQLQAAVGKRVRMRQEFTGQSGRKYQVGSIVLDRNLALPVAFVEAFANRATVPNHFMEFYDLGPVYEGVSKISVYDPNEQFAEADLSLLRKVSEVVKFGQSQSRFSKLRELDS